LKPVDFDYCAPTTIAEAIELLGQDGIEVKALAGGQSLGPLLNMRFARPDLLVDLDHISGLSEIFEDNGKLVTGAMVRHRMLERSPLVNTVPLLREAVPLIGHVSIRNRGTIGGSISHADPAAELPVVATALDADLRVVGGGGERWVKASRFFKMFLTTDLEPGELLIEARWPMHSTGMGYAFEEHARRHGDFALVSVAVAVSLDNTGRCGTAQVVLGGVDLVPFVTRAAELLIGEPPNSDLIAKVAASAATECSPSTDLYAPEQYRRRLVRNLTTVAVSRAFDKARLSRTKEEAS
jgi:carbon-monoxide dehydrogenase medium subunit